MTNQDLAFKKILVYYFTGTGHTAYLVDLFQKEAERRGAQVDVVDVTDLTNKSYLKYDVNDYDLFGLSYPIHGFRCPENMYRFVCGLQVKDKPYFILKNSREYMEINNASSLCLVKELKKKGCKLLREGHLLLPYNIHYRHDDNLVKQMLLAVEQKLPVFVQKVLLGEKKKIKCSIFARICATFVGKTEWKGAKAIGRSFVADERCISCGLCEKNCPQHNIEMVERDGKKYPAFTGEKCMICMRCVMHCPTSCITIHHYLQGWEVYGKYPFDKILADESIKGDYITKDYKGSMAKSYKKYFFGNEI